MSEDTRPGFPVNRWIKKIPTDLTKSEGVSMPKREDIPQIEVRCGGLHLIIQRVPVWLITLVTTAAGAGTAWWTGR